MIPVDFLRIGWVSANKDGWKEAAATPESNTESWGSRPKQDLHMGTPHAWEKYRQDTRNTNKDEQLSNDTG